jgi:peptide/nickel transport system ATP-binding protein
MVRVEELKIEREDSILVDIDFEIAGSTALVGESGSGKSLTLKALLGMLPSNLKSEVKIKSPFEFIRGETISLIPQNPFTALSPMTKIKKQFLKGEEQAKRLFKLLSLEERLLDEYPPNLSGGQLQRVIFAMALESNPRLLMLDEPTTALDYTLKRDIIELLKHLQQELNFLILFVTHEINLISSLCEDIVILKSGRVVERGKSFDILKNPQESYTKRLIEASFGNREFRK